MFQFQIYDWNDYHQSTNDVDEYVIQLFGRTMDDCDVCLKVIQFTPYFYIEIPDHWSAEVHSLVQLLKNKISYRTKDNDQYPHDLSQSLIDYKIIYRHKFDNFHANKKFKFLMLVFSSYVAMKKFSNLLAYPLMMGKREMHFKRYESNIEPHIRFMHINDLSSCGWVSIDAVHLTTLDGYSNCHYTYEVNWKHIKPIMDDNRVAPLKILAYDIECISCDENFPQADRKTDQIIQIGMTLYRYGSMECEQSCILVLGDCATIRGSEVECFPTERKLILAWAKKVAQWRPDFQCGYNNFLFDDKYIYDRITRIDNEMALKKNVPVEDLPHCLMNKILAVLGKLCYAYLQSKEGLTRPLTHFKTLELSSSAMGDNKLKFFHIPGILSIDMMKVIQRDHKLISYRLDNVAAHFITENVDGLSMVNNYVYINTRKAQALEINAYIQIMIHRGYSSSSLQTDTKYRVLSIDTHKSGKTIKIKMDKLAYDEMYQLFNDKLVKVYWTFAKDDIHHTQINQYFAEGDPLKIKQIAKYCLKDCKLVNLLLAKLDVIVNSMGMAKVCHVPLSYLFLRGQGVKIFSLVSKKCREKMFLIPTLQKIITEENDAGYEGAIVINPRPDIYQSPIAVLDYSSLYPNSMRERNLSQECYVNDCAYDHLDNYIYHSVDIAVKDSDGNPVKDDNSVEVKVRHRFAQEIVSEEQIRTELRTILMAKNGIEPSEEILQLEKQKRYNKVGAVYVRYGILPGILTDLLNARKETNEKMAQESDIFRRSMLNSLQLAFKITSNSLYGQTGAPTSAIYFLVIASCTTTIGREMLYFAKNVVETSFKGSEVIYGDTDSIFINFHVKDENGVELTDQTARLKTIELGTKASQLINNQIPKPQSIVYEKTYHPFILITKKKYVGIRYEKNPDIGVVHSMGIVLKRRDNAPIVKIIFGGIIDYLLKGANIECAIDYTKNILTRLMSGGYQIEQFIISKTLKAHYKNPNSIAHRVLADRIAVRDPGNAFQNNDRVPYVYVVVKKSKKTRMLQGELIEHPDYVIKHCLQIDYLHYLIHQIINPVSKILTLMMPAKDVNKMFDYFISKEESKRAGRQAMDKWITFKKGSGCTEVSKLIDEPINQIPSGKVKINRPSMDKWMTVKQLPIKAKPKTKKLKCPKINNSTMDKYFT